MVDKIELFCCWFISIFFFIMAILGSVYVGTGIGIPIIFFVMGIGMFFIPLIRD